MHADRALFQRLEVTGNRLFHNVPEKLTATLAALKSSAFEYVLQMLLEGCDVFQCLRNFGDFSWPGIGWRKGMHINSRALPILACGNTTVVARLSPEKLPARIGHSERNYC